VEAEHFIEPTIRQNICVKNRERRLACDKRSVNVQSAGTPQQFRFARHRNLYRPVVSSQKLADAIAVRVSIYQDPVNTIPRAPLQPDAEQGCAMDGHQTLGNAVCQRA
jgi:hypothetical protein